MAIRSKNKPEDHPRRNAKRDRGMAALLFAELFWKQCVVERRKKQGQGDASRKI